MSIYGRLKGLNGDDVVINFDHFVFVRQPLSTENAKAKATLCFRDGTTLSVGNTVDEIHRFLEWALSQNDLRTSRP